MKKVSIITPCRNEEKFIARCLDSIVANQDGHEILELIVVDGMSRDRTVEIVKEFSVRYPFIKLLKNPDRVQTFATNIGIRAARGDIVVRMDAHTEYPPDYLSRLVQHMEENGADCVGGMLMTMPGSNTIMAKAITEALSHPFGVGNAYFRIGSKEPKLVDTVPFGCYKREVFDKIGYFNEKLNRTDDIEFNLRLKRSGGKIMLFPDVKSFYFARSTLKDLFQQNFWNGFWVLYSLHFAKLPFSLRHLVPLAFLLGLSGSLALSLVSSYFIYLFFTIIGAYLVACLYSSLRIALKKSWKYIFLLPVCFATLHFSYGLGSLWGISRLLLTKMGLKDE
jgi:glycosyltransferase involved in cell wall biosynthesis